MFGNKKEEPASESPIMTLVGVGGQLELFKNKIIIERKGALAKMGHGFTGNKEIMLHNITGIQLKPGGNMLNGYIQFTVPGGNESKRGITAATQDENTVMFSKKENDTAQKIKDYIEQYQIGERAPASQASSIADELTKFKSLLDSGAITKEEFNEQKAKLLNS